LRAELIEAGDPRWPAFLDATRHDFYHLPAYVALAAAHEAGDPVAVLVEDGPRALLQPLIVRPIPGGHRDATTPYGYPGPLIRSDGDATFTEAAFAAMAGHLRERGLVSLFVRLHPLLNREPPHGTGSLHREGDTVSIELTLSPEEQWRQTRGNHRTHIHRAIRAGRVARFDDAWTHGGDFERLYRSTMQRVEATPWYFFDHAYFSGLRSALGDRLRLAVVDAGGTTAAAGLFVETCGIVQYHLSGSDPAFAREGLTKLMIDHVRRWATERGDEVLHLGGGVGGADDPLLHFKSGFSNRRHAFYTVRVVLDADVYARLTTQDLPADGVPMEPVASGYFPAYRSPPRRLGRDAGPLPEAEGAARELRIKVVEPADAGALGELFGAIDSTFFRPHPMTSAQARRIASHTGRDAYLIAYAGDEAVAYGMLRGWDEGYPTASLGVGVRRDRERQGYGRVMMHALHERARREGSRAVRLRVHPDNHRARDLYNALGYRPAGRERGELLMLLDLGEDGE
jgi:GNAT superfamily N-acetyltransferase